MKKRIYLAPESEYSVMWAQAIICESSLDGGLSDYDLVDGYDWQDEV